MLIAKAFVVTARCDECESLYCLGASGMRALCPECAHQLYGYANCEHEFENHRCRKCYWDGSVSEYCANLVAPITGK